MCVAGLARNGVLCAKVGNSGKGEEVCRALRWFGTALLANRMALSLRTGVLYHKRALPCHGTVLPALVAIRLSQFRCQLLVGEDNNKNN